MKRGFLFTLIFLLYFTGLAFTQGPPTPPGNAGEGGNGPVGAPIDGGFTIMLAFAAGMAGREYFRKVKIIK